MTILKDVLTELIGMFVGDVRLSFSILIVVAMAAGTIDLAGTPPIVGGAVLLAGCLAVVIFAVLRAAKAHAKAARTGNAPG